MRFGNYELGERIARGGMAEVFAARRFGAEGFVKAVAIKRILPRFTADPEFVRLFIAEARLAARLQHANIVQIHDFDEQAGAYYIAMERVHGRDLRRVLATAATRGQRIPLELALHIAMEVLKGLVAAHEAVGDDGAPLGIVHRDLSPHNILISYAGEVKVTDFGIAKAVRRTTGHDASAEVVRGKLPYMSPEQLDGQDVDRRTDLFALGLILYELVTGERRYRGAAKAGLLREVGEATLPDPAAHNAAVAPKLNDVICTLLAPDPADRFDCARAALSALRDSGGAADRTLELGELMRELYPSGDAELDRAPGASEPTPAAARGAEKAGSPGLGPWLRRGALLLVVATVAAGAYLFVTARPTDPQTVGDRASPRTPPDPAPRTPPARRRGFPGAAVQVTSVPTGGEVVVDGLPTGRRTPARLGIAAGTHRVAVRWSGGAEASQPLTVVAGKHHAVLLRRPPAPRVGPLRRSVAAAGRPSRVHFTCRPWARVLLQGRDVGQTPLTRALPPGRHRVVFKNPGLGLQSTRTVTVPGSGAPLRFGCRF